jgi:hypothetical protein
MISDFSIVSSADRKLLTTFESFLVDNDFDAIRKGSGKGYVLRRFFKLSELRGILRAQMMRYGLMPSDEIGLHYSSSDNVLLFHIQNIGISSDIQADSPQGKCMLWHFGIDVIGLTY